MWLCSSFWLLRSLAGIHWLVSRELISLQVNHCWTFALQFTPCHSKSIHPALALFWAKVCLLCHSIIQCVPCPQTGLEKTVLCARLWMFKEYETISSININNLDQPVSTSHFARLVICFHRFSPTFLWRPWRGYSALCQAANRSRVKFYADPRMYINTAWQPTASQD